MKNEIKLEAYPSLLKKLTYDKGIKLNPIYDDSYKGEHTVALYIGGYLFKSSSGANKEENRNLACKEAYSFVKHNASLLYSYNNELDDLSYDNALELFDKYLKKDTRSPKAWICKSLDDNSYELSLKISTLDKRFKRVGNDLDRLRVECCYEVLSYIKKELHKQLVAKLSPLKMNKLIDDRNKINAESKLIENYLGYKFNNINLLTQARTHASYKATMNTTYYYDYDELEYIGDAWLDIIVNTIALEGTINCNNTIEDGFLYTTKHEDHYTKLKDYIVCNESLAEFADSLIIADRPLSSYLIIGEGLERVEIKQKADMLEAIVGAVAYDSKYNLEAIAKVIIKLMQLNKGIYNNGKKMSQREKALNKMQSYIRDIKENK